METTRIQIDLQSPADGMSKYFIEEVVRELRKHIGKEVKVTIESKPARR
jgi:hypothetical protein